MAFTYSFILIDVFILLNEAYEYLTDYKSGKIKHWEPDQPWEPEDRTQVRERARRQAQMKYEEFKKTDFYKNTNALNIIVDFISVLLAIFICIGLPLLAYLAYGSSGLASAGVIIFITFPYWKDVFIDNKPKINFGELDMAVLTLIRTKVFLIMSVMLAICLLVYTIKTYI